MASQSDVFRSLEDARCNAVKSRHDYNMNRTHSSLDKLFRRVRATRKEALSYVGWARTKKWRRPASESSRSFLEPLSSAHVKTPKGLSFNKRGILTSLLYG